MTTGGTRSSSRSAARRAVALVGDETRFFADADEGTGEVDQLTVTPPGGTVIATIRRHRYLRITAGELIAVGLACSQSVGHGVAVTAASCGRGE
jgi:hypothetical protein